MWTQFCKWRTCHLLSVCELDEASSVVVTVWSNFSRSFLSFLQRRAQFWRLPMEMIGKDDFRYRLGWSIWTINAECSCGLGSCWTIGVTLLDCGHVNRWRRFKPISSTWWYFSSKLLPMQHLLTLEYILKWTICIQHNESSNLSKPIKIHLFCVSNCFYGNPLCSWSDDFRTAFPPSKYLF